jgi:CopG family nickel-responsive transcriptional regulator
MPNLVRLSLALEKPLYDKMETLVKQGQNKNRSEFVRDLVRHELVARSWEKDEEAVGTITLIFDHSKRRLSEKLTDEQHHHHHHVLASTHVHLDARLCAEMIMVRGRASEMRLLADRLGRQKGVLHFALSVSSTGKSLV